MNVSEGILEVVGHQIAALALSLEETKEINSVKGWAIKGFVKNVRLTDEELSIAFEIHSKESPNSKIGPYKNSIRNNIIFLIVMLILALYAFDHKVETRGVPEYSCVVFLLAVAAYLFFKVARMVKDRKQLIRK